MPLPKRPSRSVTPPTLTSAELDRLVTQFLTKNSPKVEPATLTTDVEYVRRIYFDLIGRPPTPQQVQSFLSDRSKDKRARLIDTLLDQPEYARQLGQVLARRGHVPLHQRESRPRCGSTASRTGWPKQLQANKPWDEIVTGMITATGRNDENGAVAFPLAYEAQPVEMAGEVSRIFMGVQIQCAQCHDHKTDAWKQRQFHEFAAFFAGMRPRQVDKAAPGQLPVFAVVPQGRAATPCPTRTTPRSRSPSPRGSSCPARNRTRSRSFPRPGRPGAPGAGRLLRHGAGQPLVRQGVHQPDLVRAHGRGLLRADRRHRARADSPRPSKCSIRWPSNGKRGVTTSAGCSARSSIPRPISGGSARRPTRPARPRSPRAAPAGSAPTRSSMPSSRPWPAAGCQRQSQAAREARRE